jgi:predicted ATPase
MGTLRGRRDELAVIADAVKSTATGAGNVVTIEGPAGIGKSSLLDEAHRVAALAGFVIAAARSDELDQVTPVGALLAALGQSDPPVLLYPDLARLRAAGHPREIEEFLRATLEAQAARHPLAISIDDLQWADRTTLFLLARLPPALFSVPILWLLACRSGAAGPPLQSTLSRLADAGAVRVTLGPLDADSAVAVAADLLGGHPDRVVAGLLEQAGGNPFYLVEFVHALKSDGQVRMRRRTGELVEAGVPRQFRVAAASHLRLLSAEAGAPAARGVGAGSGLLDGGAGGSQKRRPRGCCQR